MPEWSVCGGVREAGAVGSCRWLRSGTVCWRAGRSACMEGDRMRFSMKWALAGMAYVATAAAAFSRQTWVFADLLWAASLLALVFAALVAALSRERRQAAALGFVAASGCYLACVHFAEDVVPTSRLLAAAGIEVRMPVAPLPPTPVPQQVVVRSRPVTETKMTDKGPVTETRTVTEQIAVPAAVPPTPYTSSGYAAVPAFYPVASPISVGAWMASPNTALQLSRSGHAVGMMGFGLLGCLVGVAAHRVVRGEKDGCGLG